VTDFQDPAKHAVKALKNEGVSDVTRSSGAVDDAL
jgi:hypothetical protein